MDSRHITDQQQLLAEMAREGSANRRETSAVISPGSHSGPWAVKVTGHVEYNVYTVRRVILQGANLDPMAVGEETQAFNLAESFLGQGALASGTHVVMHRLGDDHVFYAAP